MHCPDAPGIPTKHHVQDWTDSRVSLTAAHRTSAVDKPTPRTHNPRRISDIPELFGTTLAMSGCVSSPLVLTAVIDIPIHRAHDMSRPCLFVPIEALPATTRQREWSSFADVRNCVGKIVLMLSLLAAILTVGAPRTARAQVQAKSSVAELSVPTALRYSMRWSPQCPLTGASQEPNGQTRMDATQLHTPMAKATTGFR